MLDVTSTWPIEIGKRAKETKKWQVLFLMGRKKFKPFMDLNFLRNL
jgi:hypothetical protein